MTHIGTAALSTPAMSWIWPCPQRPSGGEAGIGAGNVFTLQLSRRCQALRITIQHHPSSPGFHHCVPPASPSAFLPPPTAPDTCCSRNDGCAPGKSHPGVCPQSLDQNGGVLARKSDCCSHPLLAGPGREARRERAWDTRLIPSRLPCGTRALWPWQRAGSLSCLFSRFFPVFFPSFATAGQELRGAAAARTAGGAERGSALSSRALPGTPALTDRLCGSGFMAQVTKSRASITLRGRERCLLHPASFEPPLALSCPRKFLIPALMLPLKFCSPA